MLLTLTALSAGWAGGPDSAAAPGFTDYFPADWTGDGIPDLMVRTSSGDLLLYPFGNGTFYRQGGGRVVGSGWNQSPR